MIDGLYSNLEEDQGLRSEETSRSTGARCAKGISMTLASLLLVVLTAFIHASWTCSPSARSVGPVCVLAYNLVACVAYAPWVLYLMSDGAIGCASCSGPHQWARTNFKLD